MSIERARAHLRALGLEDKIKEFPVSSATVELAAKAVGCEPARIVKTLSFAGPEDDCILVLAAGDARIDDARFKAQFGLKARMLTPDQAIRLTGHAVGGVCPFGVEPGAKVYLDESIRRFQVVYPAAGSANSAVELTIAQLEAASGFLQWVDVCKGWGEDA